MPVRLLLADDHLILRQGLRHILEAQPDLLIVAEANSGLEAVKQAATFHPDLAIVDIAMQELNGIEATAQILKHSPQTAVLILSMHSDERYVVRAVRAGARGYVLKNSAGEDLIAAIHALQHGGVYFSPAVSRLLRNSEGRPTNPAALEDCYDSLTDRERQIYHLLAEGNSNKDIANRLDLSLHTVETHRSRIMEKMGLHSIAELVLGAVRRGLVS